MSWSLGASELKLKSLNSIFILHSATLPSSDKSLEKHAAREASKEEKCKFPWALTVSSPDQRDHNKEQFLLMSHL